MSGYKNLNKSEDNKNTRFVFHSAQNESFNEIFDSIQNGSSLQKNLKKLNLKTFNKNLQYQSDFLSSGLGQYIINSLIIENENLKDFLEIIRNLFVSNGKNQYILDMCNLGLIESLNNLILAFFESDLQIDFIQKNMFYIVIILNCISYINEDMKKCIIEEIPLERIIDFEIDYPDSSDLILLIYYLFYYLLDVKKDKRSNDQYLLSFEKYFPYFKKLYIQKKESDLIGILKLFNQLAKIPTFTDYFCSENEENTIVDDIMNLIYENNVEILECVLPFAYKILKKDQSKANMHTERYIEIFKEYQNQMFKNLIIPTVNIIRFILKYRPDLIPHDEYYQLAIGLIEYTKNIEVGQKHIFIKCLFFVIEKCDYNCLIKLFEASIPSFFVDILEIDFDDSIIISVIQELNYLVDKETQINESLEYSNLLNEFLESGGNDFFTEYLEKGHNQEIINIIQETLAKYDITLKKDG